MKKRMQKDWVAVVLIGLITLMVIPAFFWTHQQEPIQDAAIQGTSQQVLSINYLQDEQPGQLRWDGTTLLLYPNPVRNTLYVAVPRQVPSFVWLNIYQPDGQLVKRYTIESGRVMRLNVQGLRAGTYLVRIGDRQTHSWTGKFLKA